jgi:short-subunit dehydrogenase
MENSIGQLAVVTGASSGIGLELAKLFAEHGYDLVVVAEDAGLGAVADQLRSSGAMVESVQADLATQRGVEHLWERVRGLGRPVDAIAINAGVGVGGPFLETDLTKEIDMINLNVTGAVHLAKLVVKDMAQRGEGKILITSSIAAEMPAPFEAVYGATKAFLLSFAEALRNELKDTRITVTALQPGPTDTNFFHRAEMDDTKVRGQEGRPWGRRSRRVRGVDGGQGPRRRRLVEEQAAVGDGAGDAGDDQGRDASQAVGAGIRGSREGSPRGKSRRESVGTNRR